MNYKKLNLILACLFFSEYAYSEEIEIQLQPIKVPAVNLKSNLLTGDKVADDNLANRRLLTNDSAQLLEGIAGVSFYTGGGVSSLPVIDGLADDRINIKVDGVTITSACPNHMNPALSYIDPSSTKSIDVIAGVTPVSKGGDSIAGSIVIESKQLVFAADPNKPIFDGSVSGFYRSNGNVRGVNTELNYATENFSAQYLGSIVESNNYKDGNGNTVTSTEYKSQNNLIKLATRSGEHLFGLNVGWQEIPYQAYANQAMDMTSNKSLSFNANYKGDFDWGIFEARAYRQRVNHTMDMLSDKKQVVGQMPMDTKAVDLGYSLSAEIPFLETNKLKIGHEYHKYTLDDWWPAIAGSMMMGPNDFWNIRDGKRDRLAIYGEVDSNWTGGWSTNIGARFERVTMDTGNVQGYYEVGGVYKDDADAFNAKNHKRVDHNLDLTAAARYEANTNSVFDFGYARKTRSPNMHERYTWSNEAMMAGLMNNWFGDLNSYVGNIDLKPEVAHTFRATANLHDSEQSDWIFKLSPFYTFVNDYINVVPNDSSNMMNMSMIGRKSLKFVNHDAHLYGADISMSKHLGNLNGSWGTTAVLSFVRGKDEDGSKLYNIMPLNARISLDHTLGGWGNSLELVVVDAKDKLDSVRDEQKTSGYALVNFRTNYKFNDRLRLDAGIENLLDKNYNYPLGGLDYLKTVATDPTGMGMNQPVLVNAMGRSVNVGLTVKF